MTFRAVEVLNAVDLILAEDTRTAGKLLGHYQIETPTRSFHTHNEHRSVESVIEELEAGRQIALITDAGTPGISDPGYLLVKACIDHNLEFTCLPGPTAIIPAVVMSGMPIHHFYFEGFLPHKKGRQKRWKALTMILDVLVLYESPHRLMRCLGEIDEYFPEGTPVMVGREISKHFEENHRGTAGELIAFFEANPGKQKGEIVILINNTGKA